ncbi:MAG: NAD(P) transhydrogenase subunit alpha [Gemmatimonadota bacterium]
MTKIVLLRERHPLERRAALAPSQVAGLLALGCELTVESGAGTRAGWSDEEYRSAGATVAPDRASALSGARCVLKVRPPALPSDGGEDEVAPLPGESVLLSFLSPGAAPGLLEALAARGTSAVAMERIPRTTRAQRMDALSSQATAAGYHAVLLAASHLPRFFPMLTTAAGTVRPAKVIVLGAGVAGLQAIATARRLGASVQGYDIRAAAAEQVRSLGATFLAEDEALPEGAEAAGGYARALEANEKDRQLAFLGRHIPKADVVITTAQIPGRPAPLLVTRGMVEEMRAGSVVVDVAAETGGNCELSRPGETVVHEGVTILAPVDLPSGVAQHASEMYGSNLLALLKHIVKDGVLTLDPADEIVNPILVTHEGKVRTPEGGK